MRHSILFLCLACVTWLAKSTAQAATLISYLNQPIVNFDGLNDTSFRHAVDFRTSSTSFLVTTASLGLFSADSINHTLTVSLFTDVAGHPGSAVGTFDTDVFISPTGSGPGSAQIYTVTDAGILLAADSTYWLVLQMNQNPSTNTVLFTATNGNTPDAGSLYSAVSATSNLYSLDSGATWANTFGGNFRYSLAGSAVPEPSRAILSIFGVCMLLTRRLRRCT